MVAAERLLPATAPARPQPRWRGSAFGLALEAPQPLPTVGGRAVSNGRRAVVDLVAATTLDRGWSAHDAEPVVDRRFPDGAAMLRIDRHPQAGYRIWAPGYGRYVVSAAGDRIRAALPRRTWRWQRLFFAQVLPLASALQGLESFHASAVELRGHAVAFVAASGTGKTSVAAHLVAAGAPLVTDDVLALEPGPQGVLAYPGCGLVNLDESELAAMDGRGRRRLGRLLGRSDKLHFAVDVLDREIPLGLVYFLRRSASDRPLAIVEDGRPTQRLLAAGFLSYLRSPERLLNHLDACARLSEAAPTFTVEVPAGLPARGVAEELAKHATAALRRNGGG
jgi:hypothetical protein